MNSSKRTKKEQETPRTRRTLRERDSNARRDSRGRRGGGSGRRTSKVDVVRTSTSRRGQRDTSGRNGSRRNLVSLTPPAKSTPRRRQSEIGKKNTERTVPSFLANRASKKPESRHPTLKNTESNPRTAPPPPPPPAAAPNQHRESINNDVSNGKEAQEVRRLPIAPQMNTQAPQSLMTRFNGQSAEMVPANCSLLVRPPHVRPFPNRAPQAGFSVEEAHYYLKQQGDTLGLAHTYVKMAREENIELNAQVAALRKELEERTAKTDYFKRKISETTKAYQKLKASSGFLSLLANDTVTKPDDENEPSTSA